MADNTNENTEVNKTLPAELEPDELHVMEFGQMSYTVGGKTMTMDELIKHKADQKADAQAADAAMTQSWEEEAAERAAAREADEKAGVKRVDYGQGTDSAAFRPWSGEDLDAHSQTGPDDVSGALDSASPRLREVNSSAPEQS